MFRRMTSTDGMIDIIVPQTGGGTRPQNDVRYPSANIVRRSATNIRNKPVIP